MSRLVPPEDLRGPKYYIIRWLAALLGKNYFARRPET